MTFTTTPVETRNCRDCGESFPYTVDYFVSTGHTRPDGSTRLRPRCGERGNNCYSQWEARRRVERRSTLASRGARRPGRVAARSFGVEIEFHGSRAQLETAMRAQGLACSVQSYNHRVSRSAWKIVTDATVSSGGELVSPILSGENGREQIRKAAVALRSIGATVSRSCGMHVHHNARDLSARSLARLVRLYASQQTTIDGFVAPSRRSTAHADYCKPISESIIREVERIGSQYGNQVADRDLFRYIDRYRTLNVQSYCKYGTVEIRQHQGTIDGEKILAWIDFGQALIAWAESDEDVTEVRSTTELLSTLIRHGMPSESARFMADRAVSFLRNREEVAA